MCPPGYYHNGIMAARELEHTMCDVRCTERRERRAYVMDGVKMTRSKKGGKYTSKDTSKEPEMKSLFDEFAEELKEHFSAEFRKLKAQFDSGLDELKTKVMELRHSLEFSQAEIVDLKAPPPGGGGLQYKKGGDARRTS